jgi:hypothetical protein
MSNKVIKYKASIMQHIRGRTVENIGRNFRKADVSCANMPRHNELFCVFVNEEDIEQDKLPQEVDDLKFYTWYVLQTGFLLGLFFNLDDGGDIILRNVG